MGRAKFGGHALPEAEACRLSGEAEQAASRTAKREAAPRLAAPPPPGVTGNPYGEFLPGILRAALGWEAQVVVPEFPLKKVENHQSTNVDLLLFRRSVADNPAEAWILCEVKSDSRSFRETQLDRYRQAVQQGMPVLLRQLEEIASRSSQGYKYREVQLRLAQLPADRPVELLYLAPQAMKQSLPDDVACISYEALLGLDVDTHSDAWRLFRAVLLPRLADN